MNWDPQQYQIFKEFRQRAGYDLLARIPMASYRIIYDLGCGDGELTRVLQQYWRNAKVIGIDNSDEMLAEARKEPSAVIFEKHDINEWKPAEPADLIFSNAALQWLPNHQQLFLNLLNCLKPGGVLAIQIPNNYHQLSHKQMLLSARSGPWRKTLEPLLNSFPHVAADEYYKILASFSQFQDIWQTTYYHPLSGENPVFEWTMGTGLRPFVMALEEPERSEFVKHYAEKIKEAYPPQTDGITLFPFNRLFMVVQM